MSSFTSTEITKFLQRSGVKKFYIDKQWKNNGIGINCSWINHPSNSGYMLERYSASKWKDKQYISTVCSRIATFHLAGTKEQIEKYKKIIKYIVSELKYRLVFEEPKAIHVELEQTELSNSIIKELSLYAKIFSKELKDLEKEIRKKSGIEEDEKELRRLSVKYGRPFEKIKVLMEPMDDVDFERLQELIGWKDTNSDITYKSKIIPEQPIVIIQPKIIDRPKIDYDAIIKYQYENYESILNIEIQKLNEGKYKNESGTREIYNDFIELIKKHDCKTWSKDKKDLFLQYFELIKKFIKKSYSHFDRYRFDDNWDNIWDANAETRRIQYAIENEDAIIKDIDYVIDILKAQ